MKKRLGTLFNWRQWLMLYCAFSFIALGIDAAMNHHSEFTDNRLSLTPVIFAPLAVIYSIVGISLKSWRRHAWGLGILALLVGVAGTVIHNYFDILYRGDLSVWQSLLNAPRPVLAPAAFASTGLLQFLVSWGEWRHDIQSTDELQ